MAVYRREKETGVAFSRGKLRMVVGDKDESLSLYNLPDVEDNDLYT